MRINKLVLVLAASLFLGGCNRLDNHQPLTDGIVSYGESSVLSQSFTAHYDNLNIVSVCLRNPDHLNTPYQFSLYEATTSSAPVRTLSFSSSNIAGSDCTRFQFEPIAHSANKTYLVDLSATDPKLLNNPVFIETNNGKWHYKTFYYQPLRDVVIESLRQLPSRILADPLFFVIYFILIGIVGFYLWRKNG